jgi:NDP-sugar pyrophosphorylase family protein
MQIPDTLILCGGLGERLHPLTNDHQKCMLPVCGKPFVEYAVNKIKQLELKSPIFCCGHKAEEVINHFSEHKFSYRANINTGARIIEALDLVKSDNIVVFNGDSYCNIDYNYFWYVYKEFLKYKNDVCKFLVDKKNSLLASFITSTVHDYYGAGIYIFNVGFLKSLKYDDNLSIEKNIIPNSNYYNVALPTEFYVIDIGTLENYRMINDEENSFGRFFAHLNPEFINQTIT